MDGGLDALIWGFAGDPSRHSDEWMWHDDPSHSCDGFAMKVIEQPFRWAISFAPFL